MDYLQESQQPQVAIRLLVDALQHNWHADLVERYGRVTGVDVAQQVARAKKWLVSHRDDAVLLCRLGRLHRRRRCWGEARDYLLASIELNPSVDAYRQLAEVSRQLS